MSDTKKDKAALSGIDLNDLIHHPHIVDLNELAIIALTVKDLLDAGKRIEVVDQMGETLQKPTTNFRNILAVIGRDGLRCVLLFDENQWVKLIPGNGACVVVDFSKSSERLLSRVSEVADRLSRL